MITEPAVSVIVTREGGTTEPSSPSEFEAEVVPLGAVTVVTSLARLGVEPAEDTTEFVIVMIGGCSSPMLGDIVLVSLVTVVVIVPVTVLRADVPERMDSVTVDGVKDVAAPVSVACADMEVLKDMVWVTRNVVVAVAPEFVTDAALELLFGVTSVKVTSVSDGAEETPDPIEVPPDLPPSIVVKSEPIFE